MFSATKLVGLAAAVALVGGVLTMTGPLRTEPDRPLPAATAVERVEITPVHGTMETLEQGETGMCEFGPAGIADCRGNVETRGFDWDDDRLDGVQVARFNYYVISSTPYAATSETFYLENAGGSWVGSGYSYVDPETQRGHIRATMEGAGDYEGLTAILDIDERTDPSTLMTSWQGSGVIVGPGLPDMPQPASQELLHQYVDQ